MKVEDNDWINEIYLKVTIQDLEEENKKLNEELELVRKNTRANVETLDNMYWENVDLKKENKELQRENNRLKDNAMEDMRVQTKLEEEIKILKEENEKLKYNNKLYKEMIDKIQIAYIKFEEATDEKYKAFRKAYWDLDQVIMNR